MKQAREPEVKVGIIGGSGIDEMDTVSRIVEKAISTPFGNPSDRFVIGSLNGNPVAFLPRHGHGHRLLPSELNYRANIFGFKKLGVTHLLAITAVGSLQAHIRPLDMVVPDQLVDRTRHRVSTFFGRVSPPTFPSPNPFARCYPIFSSKRHPSIRPGRIGAVRW